MRLARLFTLACAAITIAACSSNGGSNTTAPTTCAVCATGMVCDQAIATCVPAPQGVGCASACGTNANCLVSGSCACAAGFDDCDGDLNLAGGTGCECAASTTPGPSGGGNVTSGCAAGCADDEVCDDNDQCVLITPSDLVGELVLDRVVSEWDDSIRREHGEVDVKIYTSQPLPVDAREIVQLADGSSCTYEENTTYPYDYNGQMWPAGIRHDGGDATFTIAGAPGPVVAKVMASTFFGHSYSHESPPALTEGVATYMGLFPITYVPAGGALSVALAGGADVGATTLNGGQMPADFNITTPDNSAGLGGHEIPSTEDLVIQWTPPQASSQMEVELNKSYSAGGASFTQRLHCKVHDSGQIKIPADRLKPFIGEAYLKLRRSIVGYYNGTTKANRDLHLKLVGRVLKTRKIRISF